MRALRLGAVEIVVLLALVVLAGCESTSGFTPRLGSELSFDGLVKVENARASAAWIDPDFDISVYSKIKLQGAGIEYRLVPTRSRRSATEFPIDEAGKQQLRRIMETEFTNQLARSERFELTEEKGPDVLLVWGELLDVVSFVPPPMPGRNDIFIRRVGEATLVVELRDSVSNTTLARMVDRRAAERPGGGGFHSNSATNTGEVRQLARSWARLLRQRLDELPSLYEGVVVPPAAEESGGD
jgi:hypothetical protein